MSFRKMTKAPSSLNDRFAVVVDCAASLRSAIHMATGALGFVRMRVKN